MIHAFPRTVKPRIVLTPTISRRPRLAARHGRRPVAKAEGQNHASSTEVSNPGQVETLFVAETLLPTRSGKFRVRAYRHTLDGATFSEPTAICQGRPEGEWDVPVRVHDACFTSEVLGSLKCDCAEQLQYALDYIRDEGKGIVIYLQQEGRGIGLANKIAAYRLQEQGLDTVDANRALGLPDDCREYTSVKNILADMGVRSIRLMTNNPRKIRLLKELGVQVTGRIPVLIQANEVNKGYLQSKRDRMDHLLDCRQASVEHAMLDNSMDEDFWAGDDELWDVSRGNNTPWDRV